MTFFNGHIALIMVGISLLFAVGLVATHAEIFPCLTFVWDSDQGFYNSTCALVDEDGEFLFAGDYTSGYDPVPTVWTWVMIVGVFLVAPYGIALVIAKSTSKPTSPSAPSTRRT